MMLSELINLQPDEKVVLKLRRHILIFVGQGLMVGALALVPFGSGWLVAQIRPEYLTGTVSRTLLLLLASAYYLNIWLFALAVFADYYLDAWIVTDQRILDIKQQGLFARTMAELELDRIQDITSDIKGIVPSIFNYGNVHIQTAGEQERFLFEQVPDAHRVRQQLMDLVEKHRDSRPAKQAIPYNPLKPV
jgi:uncharacterized membrane protein YdbT with pleckstrin-like domain